MLNTLLIRNKFTNIDYLCIIIVLLLIVSLVLTYNNFIKRLISLGLILLCVGLVHAQSKRALLIGISNYNVPLANQSEDKWNDIHGANDIDLLVPTLNKLGFTIAQLKNEKATAIGIRNALSHLSTTCKKGDFIYIHFSCHGQPVEDLDGDETDGWDEAIVPYDALKVYQKGIYTGENHIIDDELNKFFSTIRTKVGASGFVNVVIDACHAGSSYRGVEDNDSAIVRGTNRGFSATGKMFVPKIDKRSRIRVEQSKNMSHICLIEACRSYQVNNEIKEGGVYFGSLSFYVNKVLQNTSDLRSSWQNKVCNMMSNDPRLIKQNVVIETSY